MSKSFALFSQPYLDRVNQCYKNIVVINNHPAGPLGKLVKKTVFPILSQFKQPGPCSPTKNCGLALKSINEQSCYDLMTVDELPDLMTFLLMNGYKVDTSLTKMFNTSEVRFQTNNANKLICFVTYSA